MKIPSQLAAAVLATLVLLAGGAGCNTIRGAGEDIQKGGEAIQRASDQARR